MSVRLLTEHHLEFLSLKGGCIYLSESAHVKMPYIVGNHMSQLICSFGSETSIFVTSIATKEETGNFGLKANTTNVMLLQDRVYSSLKSAQI